MATLKDGGGPAFPTDQSDDQSYTCIGGGMSLRDYFAAHVLPAVYASSVARGDELQETIVAEAYEIADAMVEERSK